MEQPQYNMFHRDRVEKEYLPLYAELGLGTTIWSPLASGLLTGKYNRGIPQESRAALSGYQWIRQRFESPEGRDQIEKVRKLMGVADRLGVSVAKLAIAWCLKNPHVSSVITGASRPEQVKENMQALEAVPKLDPQTMQAIEEILDNTPEPEPNFR
jgi:aryl-alcohol dehydrogenase-like predicted oxidoreductase